MHTFRHVLAGYLMLSLGLSTSAFAQQQHAVDPSVLTATVGQHVARQDADRAAVREALGRPEVQEVAQQFGVALSRVTASVATLSGSDLEHAGAAARQVNAALAGGASTVVISTTTIIIALLVIILLIVALR